MDRYEKKLNLLSLSYSRYVSRAHTTFSAWIEIVIGLTIGFFGIVFSYSEVFELKPDIYKLLVLGQSAFIVAGIITVIAFVIVYKSRVERKDIVAKIKALRTS